EGACGSHQIVERFGFRSAGDEHSKRAHEASVGVDDRAGLALKDRNAVDYLFEADHSKPAWAEALADEVKRIHLALVEVVDAGVRAEKVSDDLLALFVGSGKGERACLAADDLGKSGDWRNGYLGVGHLILECLSTPDHRIDSIAHAGSSSVCQSRKL